MTKGFHEYYLCGDRSIESELRDNILKKLSFEVPPDYLLNRMVEIADVMKVHDPYFVSVLTDDNNNIFNYRIEITHAFTKEKLFALEELGFEFDSVAPRDDTITVWLKERK